MALTRIRGALSDLVERVVDGSGGVPLTLPDGGTVRVGFRSRHICADREAAYARRFLEALRPEMTVLDVGAMAGLFTLMAAPRVRRVISFEPLERNVAFLARNVRLAGLANVEIVPKAVGDCDGTIPFHVYRSERRGPLGMGSVVGGQGSEPITVSCTTLDSLDLAPDLIKIDVEGAEAAVIDGARETLRRHRPLLFIEAHHGRLTSLGRSAAGFRSDLVGIGYGVETVADYADDVEHYSLWIASYCSS